MQIGGLRIKHWQKLIKLLIDNIWWYGLVHMKCIRHTQLIINLVHLNIVGMSTWNYMVMYTHEIEYSERNMLWLIPGDRVPIT